MATIDNNSNNNEQERAIKNNANNIRNAANVAIASHNPYAMAAGGIVKGLDKVTNGKSTDAFGKLATRTIGNLPNGKKIQDTSNKISESGISDKVGNSANMKSMASNNLTGKNKDDIASQKLKNSKSRRGQNLFNNIRNRKKKEEEKDDSSNNQDNTSSTSELDDLESKTKQKIKVKIVISLVSFFIVFFMFFAILFAIFGINIEIAAPSANQSKYGTNDFVPTYNEGTKEYKDEIAYYEKLKDVSKKFAEEYGEELRTNYIHAVLVYIYYQVEFDENDYLNIDSNSQQNLNNIDNNNIVIDYAKMTTMVDKVVELMKPSKNKNVDYEKNGEFYNNLKKSNDIKIYYKRLLVDKEIDEIIDEIFDLASNLDEINYTDDTVITDETKVVVKNSKTENVISISDYISNSLYANKITSSNPELIKAYTIAYSTNIINENKKLSIDSNTASAKNLQCSIKLGCSYDKNGDLVDGPGQRNEKNSINYGGQYYYQQPLSNSNVSELNKNINSVFGYVLVKSDGTYPEIDINKLNGLGGGTYEDILKNAYGDYKLKNIGEDSYILDGSYGTSKVLTNVIFYDQNDYGNYSFCNLKNESIKTSGCGTTSMAMIVSTYENDRKYGPVMMMNTAYNTGYCGRGISGTATGFFKKEADIMKYKYLRVSKYKKQDLNLVLKHLSQGHLVISHVGAGHFTGGGHYMVLGGVDPETKKVYVYDPYHAANSKWRKTGNGWYSFNDIIVKESFNYFYIIWKG